MNRKRKSPIERRTALKHRKLALEEFEDRKLLASILFSESVGRTIINDNGGFYSGSDWYELGLNSSPSADVRIQISSDSAVVGTALNFDFPNTEVIFTAANWSTPQRVTVYGKGDANTITGNRNSVLTHTVVTSASEYSNATVPSLSVLVIDTDSQPYLLSYEGKVKEGDGSSAYFGDPFSNPSNGIYYPPGYLSPGFEFTADSQVEVFDGGTSVGLRVRAVNDGIPEGTHFGHVKYTPTEANPNNYSIPDFLVEIEDGVAEDLKVTGISINGGEVQRSMLTSIDIKTSVLVRTDATKFELVNTTTGENIALNVYVIDELLTVQILFVSGPGVISRPLGNTLADGRYRLSVQSGGIYSPTTQRSIGAISIGNSRSDGFYRLFGDMNGNGQIDNSDIRDMASALLRRSTSARYVPALDFAGDGFIGVDDLARFLRNLRRRV